MSWRTVVISSHCKLDLSMNCLVMRSGETKRINLDEISELIIENSGVSITGCLLVELAKKKIDVIICDEKRDPSLQCVPLYGSHDCSAKLKKQLQWSKSFAGIVWTEIVGEKIRNQSLHLKRRGRIDEAALLQSYIEQLEINDASNREGHAAKVYFNALFGKSFSRSDDCVTNAALNYGYSLILSEVNRTVCANGYLTQLGLFHSNSFNCFNLSCDLMEPWRVLIDDIVAENRFTEFSVDEKRILQGVFSKQIFIDGSTNYVNNGIKIYCKSVFDAMNDMDVSHIKNYSYEL